MHEDSVASVTCHDYSAHMHRWCHCRQHRLISIQEIQRDVCESGRTPAVDRCRGQRQRRPSLARPPSGSPRRTVAAWSPYQCPPFLARLGGPRDARGPGPAAAARWRPSTQPRRRAAPSAWPPPCARSSICVVQITVAPLLSAHGVALLAQQQGQRSSPRPHHVVAKMPNMLFGKVQHFLCQWHPCGLKKVN